VINKRKEDDIDELSVDRMNIKAKLTYSAPQAFQRTYSHHSSCFLYLHIYLCATSLKRSLVPCKKKKDMDHKTHPLKPDKLLCHEFNFEILNFSYLKRNSL
jgi:hypothetical protein